MKYSTEWKNKVGKWVQNHKENGETIYKIHYIENNTEYSTGQFLTRGDAEEALKDF